jgi:hypothetical protein
MQIEKSKSASGLSANPAATAVRASSLQRGERVADEGALPPYDAPAETFFEGCPTDFRCPVPRLWGRAEYLLWWTDGMNQRPYVTTNDGGGPPVLGGPGTTVLFGDDDLNDGARSGGRYSLGYWLDDGQVAGFEANYVWLDEESESFSASTGTHGVIGLPFINAVSGLIDARLISSPGVISGFASVKSSTDFQSLDVLMRRRLRVNRGTRVDFVAGYRYTELEDDLLIEQGTLSLAGPTIGTTIDAYDRFDTRNSFHGGQIGVVMEIEYSPRFSLELTAKAALGATTSTASVYGEATTTTPLPASTTTAGGLFAQPTNIGAYSQTEITAISEFGMTTRYRIGQGWEATFGYTFLYWSDVARSSDQIDFNINTSQFPPGPLVGTARPAFSFQTTDFWAQGLHAGLEYRY